MRYISHELGEHAVPAAALRSAYDQVITAVSNSEPGSVSGATIYTGTAGLAHAFWHAAQHDQNAGHLQKAEFLAQQALQQLQAHRGRPFESLLDGHAGVHLAGCLIHQSLLQQQPQDQHHLTSIQSHLQHYEAAMERANAPGSFDEFLYGRAGCLFGALLLRQRLGQLALPEAPLQALALSIIQSGRGLVQQQGRLGRGACHMQLPPLFFTWPGAPNQGGEPYLGAAHGLIGILYVLLQCWSWLRHDQQAAADIVATLGCVMSQERDAPGREGRGGHFPTLMDVSGGSGGSEDKEPLVHWCHGAPGAVFLLTEAAQVLGDGACMDAALRAGELVWERGLLRKGPGLCHGVAGNAYALLRLWKATQDVKWLHRAQQFGAFIASPAGRSTWHKPDHPTSLYEGLAGALCLLSDLVAIGADGSGAHNPSTTAFPLFEI